MFLEGLRLHGKGWKQIADMIQSRTVVQIRTHAQKYFQKLSKAGGRGPEAVVMDTRPAGSSAEKRGDRKATKHSARKKGAPLKRKAEAGSATAAGLLGIEPSSGAVSKDDMDFDEAVLASLGSLGVAPAPRRTKRPAPSKTINISLPNWQADGVLGSPSPSSVADTLFFHGY